MNLIILNIIALVPTRAGCAIFLGDGEKVIQFYIENGIGQAINDQLSGQSSERPMTFDLVTNLLNSLGAEMKSFVIHDFKSEDNDRVYLANMIWEMSNELEARKIVEIDCRPSDGIALAVRQEVDISISQPVWEKLEDQSHILQELKEQMGDMP